MESNAAEKIKICENDCECFMIGAFLDFDFVDEYLEKKNISLPEFKNIIKNHPGEFGKKFLKIDDIVLISKWKLSEHPSVFAGVFVDGDRYSVGFDDSGILKTNIDIPALRTKLVNMFDIKYIPKITVVFSGLDLFI